MSGAIHPLPQYAFMALCSVKKKAQGQLYLYLYPIHITYHVHANACARARTHKHTHTHTGRDVSTRPTSCKILLSLFSLFVFPSLLFLLGNRNRFSSAKVIHVHRGFVGYKILNSKRDHYVASCGQITENWALVSTVRNLRI
jgi:hypothetical protein